MTSRANSLLARLAAVLLAAYAAALAIGLWRRPAERFHDFRTYYCAAQVYARGGDPYDRAALARAAGDEGLLPFVYPPLVLPVFAPLPRLPYDAACKGFLVFKLLLLAGLLMLWSREFIPRPGVWFFAFCLLAFNSPIYIDLAAGNISIVEQGLLWAGFAFYLRRRYAGFCACIVAASFFKLTPILFLALLLAGRPPRRPALHLAPALLAFGVPFLFSFGRHAESYLAMCRNLIVTGFIGAENPSTYMFFAALRAAAQDMTGLAIPFGCVTTAYALAAAAAAVVTARALRRLSADDSEEAPLLAVFLACAAYAVVQPRLPDYSFILLLPPAYYAIRTASFPAAPILFALAVLHVSQQPLPGAGPLCRVLVLHHPLLLAWAAWGMLVRRASLSPATASARA